MCVVRCRAHEFLKSRKSRHQSFSKVAEERERNDNKMYSTCVRMNFTSWAFVDFFLNGVQVVWLWDGANLNFIAHFTSPRALRVNHFLSFGLNPSIASNWLVKKRLWFL